MAITLDDIFAKAPTAGGRATTAIVEVKDLLEQWLPSVLDRVNNEAGISIPKPKGYYIAGTKINNEWPNVIVGFSVAGSPMAGLGRVDQDHVSLAAYMAYHRIESEQQILSCLDACFWMRNIIMCYRGYHQNSAGLPCWKGLITGGIQPSPQRFPNFEGMAYNFQAWQPGDKTDGRNYWSVDTP